MRKTLLGMAGATALVFGMNTRANNATGSYTGGVPDESSGIVNPGRGATLQLVPPGQDQERAPSDEPIAYDSGSMEPREGHATEGSASGEPSTQAAERAASEMEFLRNVWTTP